MIRLNSLTTRLIIFATFWSVIILTIIWFTLTAIYNKNIEKNYDIRLEVYLKELLSNIDINDEDQPILERGLNEPLFTFPLSGWYWQISNAYDTNQVHYSDINKVDIEHILSSPSLLDFRLSYENIELDLNNQDFSKNNIIAFDDTTLRTVAKKLSIGGIDNQYIFIVATNRDNIEKEVTSLNQTLAIALILLEIGIVVGVIIQVRLGLIPLRKIQTSLNKIRSGINTNIYEEVPNEIKPLVDETNALLNYNHELVERAQRNVGNLAHGLKTPISVIKNEIDNLPEDKKPKIIEQLSHIENNITHYLNRARIVGSTKRTSEKTYILPLIEQLLRVMHKINQQKDIKVELSCPDNISFQGEKQDFVECLGNLLENSFKFAKSKIVINVLENNNNKPTNLPNMIITIEDDGKGLTKKEMNQAMIRGKRLDETEPGSGLGLSIVIDIISAYGGNMELEKSQYGGLKISFKLPSNTDV